MNIRIFLFSVFCCCLVSSTHVSAVNAKLAAKPVVYFDISMIGGNGKYGSLEYADLQRRGKGDVNGIYAKLRVINTAIAKRVGAYAVIDYNSADFQQTTIVDPMYDITHEAIDQLNKEYLAQSAAFTAKEQRSPQLMLYKAILNDSAEKVKLAVKAGADVNQDKDGKLPLLFAVLTKSSKAVGAL